MIHLSPVRPQQLPSFSDPGGAAASQGNFEAIADDPEDVNLKEALQDDENVIQEKDLTLHDGEHAGALPPRPLRSPAVMTPAQKKPNTT